LLKFEIDKKIGGNILLKPMKFEFSFRIPLISDYFIRPPTEMQKLEIKKKISMGHYLSKEVRKHFNEKLPFWSH